MCETARAAQKNRHAYRERCWQYMASVLNGFLTYSQIPSPNVTFLRWNGLAGENSHYEQAESGRRFTVPGATVLGEDGFWNLGLSITLTAGTFVSFALFVSEQDGKPVAKVGAPGKTYALDFTDQQQCAVFYEDLVEKIKQCFGDPRKPQPRVIGFALESPSD